MTTGRAVAKRLALTAVVALVVVGLVSMGAVLAPSPSLDPGPEHPEYDAEGLAPERLEASGQADPSGDVGVVLFDRSHGNRFDDEDVAPLVQAIDRAGGEVRYTGVTGGLQSSLTRADVLVIVDPSQEYREGDVEAIEEFVENGGRVVVIGEPNRRFVDANGLQVQLSTRRSKLTSVTSPFGVSFGTQYLYDMEHNDGNFKNVLTSPPDGTDAAVVEDVETVAMYTAAPVEADRGTVLLRTADTAEQGDVETRTGYPVAVLAPGGDVLAIGDKTFLSSTYHNVGDNDVFIERLVEFMAGATHRGGGGNPPVGDRERVPVTRSLG